MILKAEQGTQNSSNLKKERKEQLHRLSVEAIIRDDLPFNAFNKPGLSKLLTEAVPGNISRM